MIPGSMPCARRYRRIPMRSSVAKATSASQFLRVQFSVTERKMGGSGSGRRWDSKATTSDYVPLDVRDWQREGLLEVGRSFFRWPWDIDVITSMRRDEPNLVRLYPRNGLGLPSEPQRISITWTACNYGGRRAWFVCPKGCGHRVAILYGERSLACRHCRQLAYDSQRDSGWKRCLRQARTSRTRLGGSGSLAESFPAKPKGMHWHTYRRLLTRAVMHEQAVLGGAVTILRSLEKSSSRFTGRGL